MAHASEDPTRSSALRREYQSHLRGGYRAVMAEVRTGVVERDVFRLDEEAEALRDVPELTVFRFNSNTAKIEEFRDWLARAFESGDLWKISDSSNVYVKRAYSKGVRHADEHLREIGRRPPRSSVEEAFNQPIHRETLKKLFTRNYEGLKRINKAIDRDLSETITEAFSEGVNPRVMARRITDRVDAIGLTRANTLARTETINAHSEAALNRYEDSGVSEVEFEAELQTAEDARVCPICEALAELDPKPISTVRHGTFEFAAEADDVPDRLAGTYPLKPPIHPNCRCSILPASIT